MKQTQCDTNKVVLAVPTENLRMPPNWANIASQQSFGQDPLSQACFGWSPCVESALVNSV